MGGHAGVPSPSLLMSRLRWPIAACTVAVATLLTQTGAAATSGTDGTAGSLGGAPSATGSPPAQVASTGTITGTLANGAGAPQAGICVAASSSTQYASTKTGSDGSYSLSLAAGNYLVEFFPGCGGPNDAIQWYRDQPAYASATPVPVTGGTVTTGIGATLGPGGEITGRVLDASGSPVGGICAYAYLDLPMGQSTLYNDVATAQDGAYTFLGMESGTYTIEFVPSCYGPSPYAVDWYPNSPSQAKAAPVNVDAPATAGGIDVQLSAGGSITGRVTDAAGTGLGGICINPIEATTSGEVVTFVETSTDAEGNYTVTGLPPGEAVLDFFSGCGGGDYIGTFDGGSTQLSARPIPITAGDTTSGIDVTMSPGGAVEGTVSDVSGTPLAGICVEADATSGSGYGTAPSAGDGTYQIEGLPAGTYKVTFRSGCGSGYYRPQWYSEAATESSAVPVDVAVGRTTTGIDALLQPMAGVACSTSGSPASAPSDMASVHSRTARRASAAVAPHATWCNGYPALGAPGHAGIGGTTGIGTGTHGVAVAVPAGSGPTASLVPTGLGEPYPLAPAGSEAPVAPGAAGGQLWWLARYAPSAARTRRASCPGPRGGRARDAASSSSSGTRTRRQSSSRSTPLVAAMMSSSSSRKPRASHHDRSEEKGLAGSFAQGGKTRAAAPCASAFSHAQSGTGLSRRSRCTAMLPDRKASHSSTSSSPARCRTLSRRSFARCHTVLASFPLPLGPFPILGFAEGIGQRPWCPLPGR